MSGRSLDAALSVDVKFTAWIKHAPPKQMFCLHLEQAELNCFSSIYVETHIWTAVSN